MITTVTLNPCVDHTIVTEKFLYGGTNKVKSIQKDFAGKGINVSKALKELGAETICLGFAYEKDAEKFQGSLDERNISHDFVVVPGELRTNMKIFDASAKIMSEFNESGHPVSAGSLEKFYDKVQQYLPMTDILVLDGSVPPGVPKDIYRRLMESVNELGIRTILDAADELFLEGIKGKPYLIKPNIDEISRALGRKFRSRDEVIAAARELVGEEIRYVCVSMGAEGALLVTEKVAFFAPALSVEVEGVQGAGDSMVAGFCLAMEKGCGAKEMLQYAMAAAAGSLVKKGTELCGREEFEHYLPLARVEKVEEFFDIRTAKGELTGRVKARSLVHREGDWHGSVHMWVSNRGADGRIKILIQRRSMDKDHFPGCLDISAAGHLSAGDDFEEGAQRELYEELGIKAERGELKFLFQISREIQGFFHGQNTMDREIASVYLYDKTIQIEQLCLQEEELAEVFWVDLEELEKAVKDPEKNYCIYEGELQKVKAYLVGE